MKASPYFSGPPRSVTVKKGDTAVLSCRVHGDTPINIKWTKQGKVPLTPANNYRYTRYSLKSKKLVDRILHYS